MARRFTLKRYADQGRLRRVRFELLMEFLVPYRPFFKKRSLVFAAGREEFDYDGLAAVLREPGRDTPDALTDALFLLEDVSGPKNSDRLADLARSLEVDLPEDFTSEDAAVAVFLADPDALRNVQCAAASRTPRKYDFFAPRQVPERPIALESEALHARIERELDRWLDQSGKGRGNVSFQTTFDGPSCLVTIRHGGHYRRENRIDVGQISTFAFRPPEYDVLLIDLPTGMIGMNLANKSKRQREAFLRILGGAVLAPGNVYEPAVRYSFDPLWRDGTDAMRCDDIPGLENARVKEWAWHRMGVDLVRTVNVGTDLFAEMAKGHVVAITPETQFSMAKFELRFVGNPTPRIVILRGSNTAEYTRDEDAPLIEEWLLRRGFRLPPRRRAREVQAHVA